MYSYSKIMNVRGLRRFRFSLFFRCTFISRSSPQDSCWLPEKITGGRVANQLFATCLIFLVLIPRDAITRAIFTSGSFNARSTVSKICNRRLIGIYMLPFYWNSYRELWCVRSVKSIYRFSIATALLCFSTVLLEMDAHRRINDFFKSTKLSITSLYIIRLIVNIYFL